MEGVIIIIVIVWLGGVIGLCRWMFMCLVVSVERGVFRGEGSANGV
jgi:hypothetical protein